MSFYGQSKDGVTDLRQTAFIRWLSPPQRPECILLLIGAVGSCLEPGVEEM